MISLLYLHNTYKLRRIFLLFSLDWNIRELFEMLFGVKVVIGNKYLFAHSLTHLKNQKFFSAIKNFNFNLH